MDRLKFNYLFAYKFYKVFKRSGYNKDFKIYRKSLGRFKFFIPDKDFEFNHIILVDILYINNNCILYIINKTIRFQAAR
ncbi:uncharacterized protein Bfra_011796 [Botrytis fragariae]|uniref:Uncharacterized protein n=1 Tax=Botrytis fragariae TaxID=1964551 RepID=A0A8H6EEK1_9HELO|nr:uncharacterized protein Bfra_011796 [Botrytis fragariae]KAF5869253.1 hypothetical protein Bfra_011796 [Botrytis fragariae]